MPNGFGYWLAAQARALKLSLLSLKAEGPATVRAYCVLVLGELAARGLLESEDPPGRYAAARANSN